MSDVIARLNAALEGRYTIDREVGEGGMATVYLADDVKHNRKVALKVLKPELAAVVGSERFLAEIETTANLQHPHILPLFDSGEANGFLYYVMPYIEGETLRDRIDRDKQLPVDEAVGIATAVASALSVAHEQGVVHRDIKPSNILLSRGEPLVTDFGIAIAVTKSSGARLTETGLSVGTPYYMSPEQATGDREVTAASDVYALGCVLYEMLVGEPPYVGSTAQAVLGKILTEKPRDPTAVRAALPLNVKSAVMRALEKLPADRFTSASGFVRALADESFRYGVRPEVEVTGAGASGRWKTAALGLAVLSVLMLANTLRMALAGSSPATPGTVPVTRFDVLDPTPDDDLGLMAIVAAISPDGGHVALQEGADGSDESRILIRDMDGTELRSLTSDEEPWFPEFSPDGELVAYGVEGAIKVVPVAGGTPRTIFRLTDEDAWPYIYQWTDDGRLVFNTTSDFLQVLAIPAEGADSSEVLFRSDVRIMGGQLIPGGHFLLYHTLDETSELRMADLQADTSWTLQPEGMGARYLSNGYVVYGHPGQSLFAFPLDARTGRATGRPVPLMDSVVVYPWGRGFDVARNGTLVYSRGSFGVAGFGISESRFVEVDTTGAETPIALEAAARRPGRYSPRGDRIAFSEDDQIVVFDLATGSTTRLTVDGENHDPVWSPDESELVFRSERDGSDGFDLYRKRVDGTMDEERVTSLAGNEIPYAWTAGDTVVFAHQEGSDFSAVDILLLHLGSDADPTPFLNAPWRESSPALSPDGRWLAYESDETDPPEVFVRSFPDASGRWQVSEGGGWIPRWSPDGSGVWYRTWSGSDVMFAEVSTEPTFSVGARVAALESSEIGGFGWDVHPSGERFVVMRRGDTDTQQQFSDGRFRVVINWFDELRAQGLLGGGN